MSIKKLFMCKQDNICHVNTIYFQTIENLRNRTNVELVHTEERFIKLMSKPSVNHSKSSVRSGGCGDVTTQVGTQETHLCWNVILDLDKLLMYDFDYNILKKKYGDRVHLLFTDTDSLCVSVNTQDVYKDMVEMQKEFDCSDYHVYHFLHNEKNKKVLGKFKDEMCDKIMYDYVGLRSKMYSIVWCAAPKSLCVDEGWVKYYLVGGTTLLFMI